MRVILATPTLYLHHLRVDEHRYSIIGKQLNEKQQQEPPNLQERVNIPLRNAEEGFSTTFDEMLLINEKRPNLKT